METGSLTMAEVIARVDRAWNELQALVAELSPDELAERRDAAGWAVKDHLIHLTAWEDALRARLDGRPEHVALGIEERVLRDPNEDAANAAIFLRHRERPLAEILDAVQAGHAALRARLAALDDAALAGRPASAGGTGDPAAWIAGNTWEHYAQHLEWVRTLLGRR